jgi:hypothetical protein
MDAFVLFPQNSDFAIGIGARSLVGHKNELFFKATKINVLAIKTIAHPWKLAENRCSVREFQ